MTTLGIGGEAVNGDHISDVEKLEICRSVYRNYLCKLETRLRSKKSPSEIWEDHMEELYAFKKKYGHCRVPRNYETNPKLGRWVMNVRSHYQFIQKGRKSSLITPDRLGQLQDIDFDFAPKTKSCTKYYSDRWVHHLEELSRFKAMHGHCRVPQRFPANRKLGGWVLYVRHQYRKYLNGHGSTMTIQRIEQLAALGFDFEPRKGRPGLSKDK